MIIDQFQKDAIRQLKKYKKLADNAVAQIDNEFFFQNLSSGSNSIAVLMKHIAGNMHSRWSDFPNSDGENQRERDLEFEILETDTKDSICQFWEEGWEIALKAVSSLKPEDYERNIYIRQEPHSVLEAINRQLTHYAYHVGQILLLAKHFMNDDWQTQSIPRGKSKEHRIINDEIKYKQEEG